MSSSEAMPAGAAERRFLFRQKTEDTARQFMPAALEILETPASPIGRAVAATVMLFFALAIAWATFGYVDIIASATGKVLPSGRTKTIQPLDTGIVSAILVKDGDRVTAGQVLVELDDTTTGAERQRVGHDLIANLLDVARLTAIQKSFANLSAPSDLDPPAAAPANDVSRSRAALLAQASEQSAKIASISQQVGQKKAEARSTEAAVAKIDASLPLLEDTLSIRKRAMDIQFGNKIAWLEAMTRLTDLHNDRILQERKLAEIEAARLALDQQLAQTRAGFERQVLVDLSEAQRKVDVLKQDFVKAQQKSIERVLRAPIDGTVQQLALHTVGGVVTPAQQLMSIVPNKSEIEVEAMISNRDIGFVDAGQNAEIKVDTFNFTRYGLLHGKVTNVSQDAIVREKPADKATAQKAGALSESSEPQGQELLYSARISLKEKSMLIENKLVNLVPGMAVTAEIKTGERRIVEYLMSPLLRYQKESLRER